MSFGAFVSTSTSHQTRNEEFYSLFCNFMLRCEYYSKEKDGVSPTLRPLNFFRGVVSISTEVSMTHHTPADFESCTVFSILSVEPGEQSHVAEMLTRANDEIFSEIPGFVARRIYKSIDGRRIVVCAQWSDVESYQTMFGYPEASAHLRELAQYADGDTPVCKLARELIPDPAAEWASHSSEVFIG